MSSSASLRTTPSPAGNPPWHSLELPLVFAELESTETGLSSSQATDRLSRFGPNQLPEDPLPQWWQIGLRQFQDPLIYILGAAAVVAVLIGDVTDAAFIFAVLTVNAAIGASQEWKAEQSNRSLRKLLQIHSTVQRDGEVYEIDAASVVPGDIVRLESGNRVPADARLLTAHGFEVDESFLTGESQSVAKDVSWKGDAATPVADRLNMIYAGSMVARGRAKAVVVSTGSATQVGQLAMDVLETSSGKPPLVERMERFTRVIAVASLIGASAIAVVGVGFGRYEISEMFLFSVALVVSVIPEGLPVAMTIALSIATSRMARRGLIVRRLTAVEGLGSCTMIATDKTGTLTCNELTVQQIQLPNGLRYEVTGVGFAPAGTVLFRGKQLSADDRQPLDAIFRAAVLCNEADLHRTDGKWVWRGDTVDVALLSMAQKLGYEREVLLDRYPQVNQISYEPELQFAASFHQINERVSVFVKGAPERVFDMCREGRDPETEKRLNEMAVEMASKGYRVLAMAEGSAAPDSLGTQAPPQPSDLNFLGLIGMIDPLRPEVPQAIRDCGRAGVKVVMITGDHRVTALAIARDLGLADDEKEVMTGPELEAAGEDQMRAMVQRVRVYARVAPEQKLKIVEAARAAGEFVAVTGDGVNDAPALRVANIGVAMGKTGTDVARESAGLVLSDDNFATIVAGVEEGRIAYDNIRKVIFLSISTGAAELALMGLAVVAGLPLPLLPAQLLWLNLVTNGIQDVALAFEPGEGDPLLRKPRSPREPIFNRLMIERSVLAAAIIGGIGFAAYRWMLATGWSEYSARNGLLLLMVLFENIHLGNCRSETEPVLKLSPLRTPILLLGTIAAFLVHLAAIYHPLGHRVLHTEPVSLKQGAMLLLLALTVFPALEFHKWWWARRERRQSHI